MPALELLDFQQEAAKKIIGRALGYYAEGPDKMSGRTVPFVSQLKAVTGAGKTPILASVIGSLGPAIVLWTTKFSSVVDQTFNNLRSGGKYHHLLGAAEVEVMKFSDIPSADAWHRILDQTEGTAILISTVAAWYTSEKDERLNVHRENNEDWGEGTRWDQLKTKRHRPLWVVYDEAHNTTTEQIELLDELDPAGFFVASASPVKGKLQQYLTSLSDEERKKRVVPVSTKAVVDAELLKATISLTDFDSSTDEMLAEVVQRRKAVENGLARQNSHVVPKAIYVVEASNAKDDSRDARPIAIWKALVNQNGVRPASIAVCTNTKNLPVDAIAVKTLGQLSDAFTHIIFNKKLQEGWDDPSVYVCYFDGETTSATRIQQVVGRALRQPEARHFSDEDLNTAFFYINCPSEALDTIVDELKEELRIYKGDDEPDDFEPFQIKEEKKALPRIALRPEYVGKLRVPLLQLELPPGDPLLKLIKQKTLGFDEDDRSAPGKALVSIVSVKTGYVAQQTRDLFEDMRVRAGLFLQQEIRSHSRNCVSAIHPKTFSSEKLDKTACYGSKALEHYRDTALEVVKEYESRVELRKSVDTDGDYIVETYQPSGGVERVFDHSAHPKYDAKGFNPDELKMAKALDEFKDFVWVRNKSRLDYGIPLPRKSGTSSTFFPDFLWWVKDCVWAIDPTGAFLADEKIKNKLLHVPDPLRIALVTPGKYDENFKKTSDDGWTLSRRRMGSSDPERFDSLADLLQALVDAS
jgi:type III restriction enzyme